MPDLSQLTDYDPDVTIGGNGVPTRITVRPQEPDPALNDFNSNVGTKLDDILNKLTGANGQQRYQLWPEKVIREGLSAAGNALAGNVSQWAVDKDTGEVHTSPQMIEKAQEISALAGTGGLAGADATLGSTAFLRPALKYKDKIYKGKEGQQHQDVIPKELYPEFEQMAMNGEDISHYNFGFMNHKGQFLDREKALEYAINEGLVDAHAGQYGALTSTLMADSSKPGTAIEAMAKTASPFFSALEHNVSQISQSKMTGEQWLGTLSNKPGVKPEELQWTGLGEFLKENGNKPVTKEQIQEHLANNKVELKEVNKGGGDVEILARKLAEEENGKGSWDRIGGGGQEHYYRDARKELGTKYHSYQLPGGPLSRDTEILTNKGWKRIDAVEIGDVVMTRKDEAGILEWQPVQATPKVYAENLYHFFSQSINMRVTENHQMIAKKRRRNSEGLQRLTAKELWGKSEMLVPLTGVWDGGETDKIFGFEPNDLAELFGWYLAEGSYKCIGEVKNTIQIAQYREYNSEKCDRIEALLNRMGLAWKYYGQAYGIGTKTLNKDLVELFHEQPTSEFKFIPYFFFNQNKSVIQSLLDGLSLGDGCTAVQEGRLDKTVFHTKSEQLAGDVQILILMIGKNANVRQRPSGLYCVGIKSKEWSSVDEAKFEIAPYNDFAFCVTVENHAIYVRRNGVAAFTGNSNYRERLLTLPPTKNTLSQFRVINEHGHVDSTWTDKAKAEAWAAKKNYTIREDKPITLDGGYKSSHWDEPNILAHVRMNDRTIDGKKSLHLEEIQSDWHQQGRDRGYVDPANTNPGRPHGQVPDAPFKKSWHELALKRMIREAAEKGYDSLSWTPGEAQAARYDLSKSIDRLAYNPATGHLQGFKNKQMVLDNPNVDKSKLPDFVGKEAADKILNKPTSKVGIDGGYHQLENADLKVGGEGMKGFYDKMIPAALEKIGKEHGVKVKRGEINAGKGKPTDYKDFAAWEKAKADGRKEPIHYIDIPQSLKDQAMHKGFPLFSKGFMFVPVDHEPDFGDK